MSEHTPGPWEEYLVLGDHYGRFKGCAAVWADNRNHLVAICPNETHIGEGEANARLIAAAPQLLAACKYFIEDVEELGIEIDYKYAVDQIKAAIALVEGGNDDR